MDKIFFYLLILIYPLGQLLRINIGNLNILGNDIIVGVIIFTWLFINIVKKKRISIPKNQKIIVIFSLYLLFTLFINYFNFPFKELLSSALYLVRFFVYSLIYLFIFNQKLGKQHITNALIISVLAISIIGLVQYAIFPDLRFLVGNGWDPHYFRLTAPFFDPIFTGAILTLGIILLVSLQFDNKLNLKSFIFLSLMYIALALTYSRASYLMYFVAMTTISIIKKSPRFFISFLLIGIITIVLLPKQKSYGTNLEREETAFARIKNWQNSIFIWKRNPVFGVGFNTYKYVQKNLNLIPEKNIERNHAAGGADSSLLFVAATSGIIGLILYIYIFYKFLKNSFNNKKNGVSLALFLSIIGLFIHSFFSNSLFYPFIMEWFWILAALNEKTINTKG